MLNISIQRRALQDALAEMRSPELKELRDDLVATIEGHDAYDQADDATAKELVALWLEQRYMKVAQARIAASKLNEGLEAYVTCSGCEGEIAESRLIAVPWAILCSDCQQRQERDEIFDNAPVKGVSEVELELLAKDA